MTVCLPLSYTKFLEAQGPEGRDRDLHAEQPRILSPLRSEEEPVLELTLHPLLNSRLEALPEPLLVTRHTRVPLTRSNPGSLIGSTLWPAHPPGPPGGGR